MKHIVSFLVCVAIYMIAMSNISQEKIRFNTLSTYFFYVISVTLYVLNYEFSLPAIRVVLNTLLFICIAKYMFKLNIRKSIILGIYIIILATFSEILYALFAFEFLSGKFFTEDAPILVFINNLGISLILLCLSSIGKVKKLYKNIISSTYKISERKIILSSLAIVLIANLLSILLYFFLTDIKNKLLLPIIGSFLSLVCVIIVFIYFKTQNKYLSIYEKYNISLESIREFELMIENYRVNTHENKNQFRTIRNMSKNKKINSYIDALLEENVTDDEKVLYDTQKIPAGGLRGIIYSKLLLMQQQKIPFELVIDKKVTVTKVSKIDDYTLTAICRILGVLLDNAIEAVKKLDNKYIMVELYEEENNLIISITNNYEGYVDIDNIGYPGISEKGENHGYGLALVQKLVKQHKKIQHSSEFFEDNFMQMIKIKV